MRKLLLLFLAMTMTAAPVAWAQNYPSRAIHILTSGAGGGTDVVTRMVGKEISVPLGQPVVVENRPNTGTLSTGVAKAPPDGYTLLVWGPALWTGPLMEPANYDALRDFAPIATLTKSPSILVVHPSLPVKTVADLVKLAKERPGELNYVSGPSGSSSEITGELFKSLAGINLTFVRYKGGGQVNNDLLSGTVHLTFGSVATWSAQLKANKMRVLASTGSERSLLAPDVPTMAETLPGFVYEAQFAFFAPAKTPDAVVRRLNQEANSALRKPELREQLLAIGQEPAGGTPEQLAESMKAEIARLGKLIKDAGLKPSS